MAMAGDTPAKHEVRYACGHSEVRVKSQNDAVNKIVINAAARNLCKACLTEHSVKREAMISNSVQRTQDAVAATKLTGSTKQIERADRIREKWLLIFKRDTPAHSLESSIEKARSSGALPGAIEHATTNVLAVRLAAIDEVLTHSKAAWWIDFQSYLDFQVNKLTEEAIKTEFSVLLQHLAGC
jgi:hypothetical protein